MPQWSALPLYWIGIALLALAGGAIAVSILQFRHARTAPYYFMREAARRNGIRWFLLAVVALILGGSTFYIHQRSRATIQPPIGVTVTASAMVLSPTATVPSSPTATRTPSPSPSPIPPSPTSTPLPTPTPTPYPMPETALSPLPGAVPARPDARIVLETFALGVENGRPVQPGTEFTAGDFRVYAALVHKSGQMTGKGYDWGYEEEKALSPPTAQATRKAEAQEATAEEGPLSGTELAGV
ncbi:MAG: hypothetical protein H5T61_06210 [Thermoflexales bacterium]|nr:hypothetical protein [Thermoflexales bacterium]